LTPLSIQRSLDVAAISFPVLLFKDAYVYVHRTPEQLTTTTSLALKKGFYNGALVMEGDGRAHKLTGATKLRRVGPLIDTLLLNPRIRVELIADGEAFRVSPDESRERIMESLRKRHSWKSRGDFEDLREGIQKARSIQEMIELLGSRDASSSTPVRSS
jgi:hypothetical protein